MKTPGEILVRFCAEFHIRRQILRSNGRNRWLVDLRTRCALRMRKEGHSYHDIGIALNRDHASVIHMLRDREPRTARARKIRKCECGKPVTSRGMCSGHYMEWYRSRQKTHELRMDDGAPRKIEKEIADGVRCRCGLLLPCHSCLASLDQTAQRGGDVLLGKCRGKRARESSICRPRTGLP